MGRRFEHGTNGPWRQIIGVVEDGKYRSLSESPMPAVFEPMEQDYSPNNNLIARSSLPEEQVTGMLRRAVMDLDSSITLATQGSWTGQLGLALFPARIAAIVLGAFGVLAIVLAATGVAIGTGIAWWTGRLVASYVFDVSARDPIVLGLSAAIVTMVAVLATLVPARRAASLELARALRGQ